MSVSPAEPLGAITHAPTVNVPPPRAAVPRRNGRRGVGIAVAVVIAIWFTGAFDKTLVSVGLNKNDCYQNGFGATFCGAEAEEYQRNVVEPINDAMNDPCMRDPAYC